MKVTVNQKNANLASNNALRINFKFLPFFPLSPFVSIVCFARMSTLFSCLNRKFIHILYLFFLNNFVFFFSSNSEILFWIMEKHVLFKNQLIYVTILSKNLRRRESGWGRERKRERERKIGKLEIWTDKQANERSNKE